MSIFEFPLQQLPQFVEFLKAEGIFLPHEIQKINDEWQHEKSHDAELEGGKLKDEQIRKSSVMPLYPGADHDWIFERMRSIISECNQFYNFDLNGFYEPLQMAEYGQGDFFDWHLDFGSGQSSNRKLSLTIQLSESNAYEGGDLEFQINNETVKAPRTPGTIIVFPSFIRHRVTKITKGKRRSIVGWVSGPPFR